MSVTLHKGPWQLTEKTVMAIYTGTIRGKKTKSDMEIEIIVNGDNVKVHGCNIVTFGKHKCHGGLGSLEKHMNGQRLDESSVLESARDMDGMKLSLKGIL